MTTRKRRTKLEILNDLKAKLESTEFDIAYEKSQYVRDLTRLQNALFTLSRNAPVKEEAELFNEWYERLAEIVDNAVETALAAPEAEE